MSLRNECYRWILCIEGSTYRPTTKHDWKHSMTWSFFAQCSRVQQLPAPYKRLINDVNKPTNRPTNNRRIETDQWLLTNSTRVFQPITSRLNRPITFNRPDFITSSTDNYSSLDSEDDYRTDSRNVSHQQQFFSELHSPGRSHYTNYWYSWVQTIYFTFLGFDLYLLKQSIFIFKKRPWTSIFDDYRPKFAFSFLLLWL